MRVRKARLAEQAGIDGLAAGDFCVELVQFVEELQDFVADVFRRNGAEGGMREGAF